MTHPIRALRAPVVLLLAGPLAALHGCGGPGGEATPSTLTVMTYNIHYGDPNLRATADVICGSGAHVVGLQEVDVHWGERSAFAHQAEELARACGMDYRYGPIYTLPPLEAGAAPRQFGVAVLSSLPILGWENHLLTRLSTQSESAPTPMPGFLQVTIEWEGGPVDVYVTHLDFRPDPAVRATQVADMLRIMGSMERPTVLLGDLNAPPERKELAPLFARMRDAWAHGEGDGFTFPGDAPVRRIDYVLVAGPLDVSSVRVLDTAASDHRPVMAELVLTPPVAPVR
jgi:endonuclease/exonuclease/phosphatase family metal-dependent hydrolase